MPSGRRADRKQRELHPDIFYRAKQEEDRNDDDDIFHWQDERTLVNDLLQHDGSAVSSSYMLISRQHQHPADSLNQKMTLHSPC